MACCSCEGGAAGRDGQQVPVPGGVGGGGDGERVEGAFDKDRSQPAGLVGLVQAVEQRLIC